MRKEGPMITYRLEKGAPLSVLEIDNNFRALEQRLKNLEDKNFDGDFGVEQKEDVLIFKCGETVSHIVLPKFQPIFKGAWTANYNYRIGCWVYVEQKLYACTAPHISGDVFETTFWQLVFDGKKHDE
jgi:hypothetical protein